jgi:hypothetical protein
MTNSTTTSKQNMTRSFARHTEKLSDEAPMMVTRLSGWIDPGEGKSATPSWIVPTRTPARNQ